MYVTVFHCLWLFKHNKYGFLKRLKQNNACNVWICVWWISSILFFYTCHQSLKKANKIWHILLGRIHTQTWAVAKWAITSGLVRDDCTQAVVRVHAHIKHASSIKQMCSPRHFVSVTTWELKGTTSLSLGIIKIHHI